MMDRTGAIITCAASLACSCAGTGTGTGTFWFWIGDTRDSPRLLRVLSQGSGTGNRPHCFFLCWPLAAGPWAFLPLSQTPKTRFPSMDQPAPWLRAIVSPDHRIRFRFRFRYQQFVSHQPQPQPHDKPMNIKRSALFHYSEKLNQYTNLV